MEEQASNKTEVASSAMTNVVNIFVSPMEVFNSLQLKPTIVLPFFLPLISLVVVYVWYFTIVDFPWLIEQMLVRMGDIPQDEIAQIQKVFEDMGSTGMMVTQSIGIVVMTLLLYSLQAGYLSLISAITGDAIRFKQWFSLTSWTYLIGLLSVIAIVINILLSENGQISVSEVNALSFSGLGLGVDGNTSLQSLFDTLNLTMFWSLGLLVVGYQHWVKPGYAKASLIVLTPHVLIYGIWALISLI
jgi:hypothetical protein